MFGKYIMKKTQQKRRGGKTQKRRGGKTQKRRGGTKETGLSSIKSYTTTNKMHNNLNKPRVMKQDHQQIHTMKTKENLNRIITDFNGTEEKIFKSIYNINCLRVYHFSMNKKFFYIKKDIYVPETFDTAESNKKIVHKYAVEFDYKDDEKKITIVIYFEELDNCIDAINEYYMLTPQLNRNELQLDI